MPTKAGQIVIDISAGTAKFVQDLENAKGQVRQFGAAATGSNAQASASLRVLEGNITNNNRAVARFLTQVLGLGPVLNQAFQVLGAVAFVGMIENVSSKTYTFFRNMQEAPQRIASAARVANEALALTNDELRVSNDRLSNEIAKLEGRRENTLKLALDEAKLSADKLAESLEKDIANVNKLLKEENIGFWKQMWGNAGTGDLKNEFGGETGSGGFAGRLKALGGGDPKALLKAYQDELAKVNGLLAASERLQAKRNAQGPVLVMGGIGNPNVTTPVADQSARIELLKYASRSLQEQMEHIQLATENAALTGKKPAAEQARKDLEVILQLTNELRMAEAARQAGLEKINVEEQAEISKLKQSGEWNASTQALVESIYNVKRINSAGEGLDKFNKSMGEQMAMWQRLEMESKKALGETFAKEIEDGRKKLEERTKAIGELSKEYNKLSLEAANANVAHATKMAGINSASGGPVAQLAAEQAVDRSEIMKRFNQAMAEAATSTDLATRAIATANAIKARDIELNRQAAQMEETLAQQRQKGIRDFFLEMQYQFQSLENIVYQGMHSLTDGISDELAKLVTGQKTAFGKMLEQVGEQMLRSAIKSALDRGIGALGKVFSKPGNPPEHKPSGNAGDPVHVFVDNQSGGGPGNLNGSPIWGALPAVAGAVGHAASGIGGFLGSLFHSAGDISIGPEAMAEGGDVYPGNGYWVGDGGEPEFFSPSTRGTITPASKMGTNVTYNVNAPGADLGAANRISRAIEAAHASAVANGVRANAERSKRTPQRSGH